MCVRYSFTFMCTAYLLLTGGHWVCGCLVKGGRLVNGLFVKRTVTQAIYCDISYQGGWLPPHRFRVRFKVVYRLIQRLIQHCLLSKMVNLNLKYVIGTRSCEFFYIYAKSHWKYHTFEGYYICNFTKLRHKVHQKV